MTHKYEYHGMDITLDVYEKTRSVVEMIADMKKISFDEAFALFASSKTCAALSKTDSLMWSESVEFIFDEFCREQDVA